LRLPVDDDSDDFMEIPSQRRHRSVAGDGPSHYRQQHAAADYVQVILFPVIAACSLVC
jgi:hypothetical protein